MFRLFFGEMLWKVSIAWLIWSVRGDINSIIEFFYPICFTQLEQMIMQRVGQSWRARRKSDHLKPILSRLKRPYFMPEDLYLLKVFLYVLGRKLTFLKCPVKGRHSTRHFYLGSWWFWPCSWLLLYWMSSDLRHWLYEKG